MAEAGVTPDAGQTTDDGMPAEATDEVAATMGAGPDAEAGPAPTEDAPIPAAEAEAAPSAEEPATPAHNGREGLLHAALAAIGDLAAKFGTSIAHVTDLLARHQTAEPQPATDTVLEAAPIMPEAAAPEPVAEMADAPAMEAQTPADAEPPAAEIAEIAVTDTANVGGTAQVMDETDVLDAGTVPDQADVMPAEAPAEEQAEPPAIVAEAHEAEMMGEAAMAVAAEEAIAPALAAEAPLAMGEDTVLAMAPPEALAEGDAQAEAVTMDGAMDEMAEAAPAAIEATIESPADEASAAMEAPVEDDAPVAAATVGQPEAAPEETLAGLSMSAADESMGDAIAAAPEAAAEPIAAQASDPEGALVMVERVVTGEEE